MMIRGSVDLVTDTEVRGWAFASGQREPVLVQAILNHEILGEAIANLHRPDLAAAGIGDGKSGYLITLFRAIDPLYLPFIVVKIDGGDAELPRAPSLGFGEFFASFYRSYPTAGRSRSVFGGLWTDRTDAAAVLRGKTKIGQVPAQTVPLLAQLIQDGFTTFELGEVPLQRSWGGGMQERMGELPEDPALLPLLRAALEDNPLIVKADWVDESDLTFFQPSTNNSSPSPAECVDLVVPFGDAVFLDVVRDSHRLPEFTPLGVSRWATRNASDVVSVAAEHGLLESRPLIPGNIAVIGPGTLFRVRVGADSAAVRGLCLPGRGMPVSLAVEAGRRESVRESGVRVWA